MRLTALELQRYGALSDASIALGPGLTVVIGPNESGKSTTLQALADLLWGAPYRHPLADLVPRAQLLLSAELAAAEGAGTGPSRLVRTSRGLFRGDGLEEAANPWGSDGEEQRAGWLRRFGLDHQMLRKGGQQVCDGAGDLAELRCPEISGHGPLPGAEILEENAGEKETRSVLCGTAS
jgi:AAA domain